MNKATYIERLDFLRETITEMLFWDTYWLLDPLYIWRSESCESHIDWLFNNEMRCAEK